MCFINAGYVRGCTNSAQKELGKVKFLGFYREEVAQEALAKAEGKDLEPSPPNQQVCQRRVWIGIICG